MIGCAQQNSASVIVGLGDTGFSCARYFIRRNLDFRVVDSRRSPPRLADLENLKPDVEVDLGEFRSGKLLDARELVVSPGVDLRTPALAAAVEGGVPVTGDIDIFSREANSPIVAVTGSNGKSTVVAMLAGILDDAGVDYGLGGNLDGRLFCPALDLLEEEEKDWYLLEISSFQLETTHQLNAEVALILNLSADHLDRYDALDDYARAKQRVFRGCRRIVLNRDEPFSRPPDSVAAPVISFGLDAPAPEEAGLLQHESERWLALGSEPWLPVSALKAPGDHNVANALAAMALALAMGVGKEHIVAGLRRFTGLPHRCQWVANIAGVDYYNDSKATNPGATAAAVLNLARARAGRVLLIAGGVGKAADFSVLAPAVRESARAAILIGRDADRIAGILKPEIPLGLADTLEEAVVMAREQALPGDAVLLSPACASFDMFDNFQHRGETFVRCVERLQ